MQTAAQGSAAWIWWIMLAFAFVVIFLPARSQKKREQEMKAKVDALQAKEYAEQAKKAGESARSVIMYQYAAKEYVEIWLKPRGDNGVLVLPEKEYSYYQIFKKVLNGEKLEQDDAKKLQNYILVLSRSVDTFPSIIFS